MADKPTLYLESTIPSYLTARPSRDVVVLAHQEITREWWKRYIDRYEVYVSEVVFSEVARGDPGAARLRVETIQGFPVLQVTEDIRELARVYLREIPLPSQGLADAMHLALAAWNEMDYVLTWNCRHIAGGRVKRRLAEINPILELRTPTICTPEELL